MKCSVFFKKKWPIHPLMQGEPFEICQLQMACVRFFKLACFGVFFQTPTPNLVNPDLLCNLRSNCNQPTFVIETFQ